MAKMLFKKRLPWGWQQVIYIHQMYFCHTCLFSFLLWRLSSVSSVQMLCCGCASITLPRSAAGTTCMCMMETPFTPLWLPCSGKRLQLWIGELRAGGRLKNDSGSLWLCFRKAFALMHSNNSIYEPTMAVIITVHAQYRDNRNTTLQLLMLILNTIYLLEFSCMFSPFHSSLQACGWDTNSLKSSVTTIIYQPPTFFRLISFCAQNMKSLFGHFQWRKLSFGIWIYKSPDLAILPTINKLTLLIIDGYILVVAAGRRLWFRFIMSKAIFAVHSIYYKRQAHKTRKHQPSHNKK